MRIDDIRKRIWHSLSPQTAAVAGLSSPAELQRVLAGTLTLSEPQLAALARHFGMESAQ
jgi:hypothetical protein